MKDLGLTYVEAMHGVQCAVGYEQQMGSPDGSPKHLRTGISSAMITDLATATLLIAKGIFTKEEYMEAVGLAANSELSAYEDRHPGRHFR